MEGVVASRQIILGALALRIRLELKIIWFVISFNRCRPRSATSKPEMQSDTIPFNNYIGLLRFLILVGRYILKVIKKII
ncbi:hypothetical protein [Lapidilactobacillus wuchangensis]|uniref:hypothetical protein n=1 Tax=Lapidilactobacillus wuchangensis TaxID=2486001 RepID=UPI0013DE78E0|nr:hypothetical protein [Lapidilactobacillus wuchangensis]